MKQGKPSEPTPSLWCQFLSVSFAAASLNIAFFTCFGWYRSTVPSNASIAVRDVWHPVMLYTGLFLTASIGVLIASKLSGSRFIWYACGTIVIACIAAQYVYIFNLFSENNSVFFQHLGDHFFNRWLRGCAAMSAVSAVYACVLLAVGKAAKWYLAFRAPTQQAPDAV